MINFLGFFSLLGGAAGIAASLYSKPWGVDLSIVMLAVNALWIALGIGLLRRQAWARKLAIGLFLLSSFSFVIVPALFSLIFMDGPGFAAALSGLAFVYKGFNPYYFWFLEHRITIYATGAALLIAMSALSYWIYRYLKQEETAAAFSGEAAFTSILSPYLVAAAWGALLYGPGLTQLYQHKKGRMEEAAQQESHAQRFLIGQMQVSRDGQSLAVASDEGNPQLVMVDVASGLVTKKDRMSYGMQGKATGYPDRLASLLSEDHRVFFARKGTIQLATNETRALGSIGPSTMPIGFRGDGRFFLFFTPVFSRPNSSTLDGATVGMVDIEADRLVYSTRATRPEWIGGSEGANDLPRAINTGLLSPGRDRFAFLYRDRLHLINTETGELHIVEQDMAGLDSLTFAAEGDAILANVGIVHGERATAPGLLLDLKSRAVAAHSLHGAILYFSTVSGALVRHNHQGVDEFSLADLSTPRWRIPASPRHAPQAVSADGAYLFLTEFDPKRFVYAELAQMRAGTTPVFKLLPVKTKLAMERPVLLKTHGPYALVIDSPQLELIRTGALGGGQSVQLNLAKPGR